MDILEISCRSYKQGPRYPRYDYFEHVLQRNLLALLYQQGAPDSRIYVAEMYIYIYATEPGGQPLFGQSDIAYVVYRSDISIDFVSVNVILSNVWHILFPSLCAHERSSMSVLGPTSAAV
jgi:hypothetical protein